MKYGAIVIGVSAGGLNAMKTILPTLPAQFGIPIVVVQHIGARSDGEWFRILEKLCNVKIKEAEEKEEIKSGVVYVAPPNYHLLIERDRTFSFSIGERVNFSRPSIDVLFETASEVYGDKLIGVILTGANSDGAQGLKKLRKRRLGGCSRPFNRRDCFDASVRYRSHVGGLCTFFRKDS